MTAAALLCAAISTSADAAPYPVELIGHGFYKPTYLATPPKGAGGGLFVVQETGVIRVVRHGKTLKRPFLDLKHTTMEAADDQRGMFSMAFAPDYARSRRFYVMYVHTGDVVVVDEFRRSKKNASRAVKSSRRRVLTVGQGGPFHHGGQLQFGRDRMLYISTGVSDHPEWAQDLGNLHGKILRIDPRRSGDQAYTVPHDNPFVFTAGARPEVWAWGLRNPWRFSFDRRTGAFAVGDVGENDYEEIDYRPAGARAGANFGFPIFEGRHRMKPGPKPSRYVPPVIEHRHSAGYCAVMGGYWVRDRRLRGLYGRYVYGDNCKGTLRSAVLKGGKAHNDRLLQRVGGIVSLAEDNRGHIYVVTNYRRIMRLEPKPRRITRRLGRPAGAAGTARAPTRP